VSLSADRKIASMDGPAALPRKNGELVFEAPWEGRAFGMAVALSEARHFDWEEFRQALIAEIAEDDAHGHPAPYYEQWLASFEHLLTARGILTPAEIERRTAELASGERADIF
jgi:nitrile hydratase accessory protein